MVGRQQGAVSCPALEEKPRIDRVSVGVDLSEFSPLLLSDLCVVVGGVLSGTANRVTHTQAVLRADGEAGIS